MEETNPRIAAAKCVAAQRRCGANNFRRQGVAHAAGMGNDEVALQGGSVLKGNVFVRKLAETGC